MSLKWDEIRIGDRFRTDRRTMAEADLILFCQSTWNTEGVHNDMLWVKEHTSYRDRTFPGLFLMSVQSGLELQLGVFKNEVFALLGVNNARFPAPVFPGDTIHSVVEVIGKRESRSKPNLGILTVRANIVNQDEQICAEWERLYAYLRS